VIFPVQSEIPHSGHTLIVLKPEAVPQIHNFGGTKR